MTEFVTGDDRTEIDAGRVLGERRTTRVDVDRDPIFHRHARFMKKITTP
jgi:hypothetical protein